MKWYFSAQLPGQVETEAAQRDRFSNDEVEISETIVLEAVQNSLEYLKQWSEISTAFDIATSFFEIGALLALDGQWQKLGKSASSWAMR